MPKAVHMKIRRRIVNPDKPPIGAHYVGFNRVGGEVVMDIGFFDMAELVNAMNEVQQRDSESGEEEQDQPELEFDVTVFAQYSMSADTFLRLRENVEHIYSAMVKSGHVIAEDQKNENPTGSH